MTWVLSVPVFFQLFIAVKTYFFFIFRYMQKCRYTGKWEVHFFHPVSYAYTKCCKFLQSRDIWKPSTMILVQYRYISNDTCFLSELMPKLNLRKSKLEATPSTAPIPFHQDTLHALNSTAHFWLFEVSCPKGHLQQMWLEQCGKMETFCWQSIFTAKSWWKPSAFLGKAPPLEKLFSWWPASPSQSLCTFSCLASQL